jgi:hypothetical protein
VSNLSLCGGQPGETRANTAWAEAPSGASGKDGLLTMLSCREGLAGYQLVGEVTAHQGGDG